MPLARCPTSAGVIEWAQALLPPQLVTRLKKGNSSMPSSLHSPRPRTALAALAALVLAIAPLAAPSVHAAKPSLGVTITVTSTADVADRSDGQCTLREAIVAAETHRPSGKTAGECLAGGGGATTTTLDLTRISGTITLVSALRPLTGRLTLTGPGSSMLTIDGAKKQRIFFITAGAISITGLTLAHGRAEGGNGGGGGGGGGGGAGLGGAVFVQAGQVGLTGIAFTNNTAKGGDGGGRLNDLTCVDCSIVYQSAPGYGGGGGGGFDGAAGAPGAAPPGSGGAAGGKGAAFGGETTTRSVICVATLGHDAAPAVPGGIYSGGGGGGGGGSTGVSVLSYPPSPTPQPTDDTVPTPTNTPQPGVTPEPDLTSCNGYKYQGGYGSAGGAGGFGGGGGGGGAAGNGKDTADNGDSGKGGAGGFGGGDGSEDQEGGSGGSGYGGALFVRGGTVTLASCTFTNNTAKGGHGGQVTVQAEKLVRTGTAGASKGGAIAVYTGATVTAAGVTFNDNKAKSSGTSPTDNANVWGVVRPSKKASQ